MMDALATAILGIYLCCLIVGLRLTVLPARIHRELILLSCLPVGIVALYYLHLVDGLPVYYSLRSLPYMELSCGILGLGVGLVAKRLHARNMRFLVAVLVPAMAVVSLLPYVKHIVAPLDAKTLEDRWEGPYCLQSTGGTCGPACLATFLNLAGKRETEREVARASLTTASGTEAWYLARHARERGLTVDFHQLPADALKGKRGIIGVRLGADGAGHFLALLSCDGKTVEFVDPLSGHDTLPLDAFLQKYAYTGFLMSIA